MTEIVGTMNNLIYKQLKIKICGSKNNWRYKQLMANIKK